MNQFIFEMKKIKSKRFLYLLIVVPVVTVLLLFTYRFFTAVDFQEQETVKANQLLRDLNWRLSSLDYEYGFHWHLQDHPEYQVELTEHQQTVYDLLDEAERERFNYSVSVYYEEWRNVNLAKQKIWDNLIDIANMGEELYSTNLEELQLEKHHIDWLVEYDVDTLDVGTDRNSQFLLFNAFQVLFSLPAMILFIFFFSLAMFLESKRPMFNFTKVLPVSHAKVMSNKLLLFFAMLATYILSIIIGSFLFAIFDSAPISGQLNYPMVFVTEAETIIKPLWQLLSYQVLFFIGLTLLSLVLIRLFAQVFNNELFVTFIYGATVLIGSQISRLSPLTSQRFNPFAWFDTVHFIQSQSAETILTVLVILLVSVILLVWFVLLRDLSLPSVRRSATYRGIRKLSSQFLLKFEGLKIHRQAILFYSSAIIIAFTIFLGVDNYQEHQTKVDDALTGYQEQYDIYQEALVEQKEFLAMYDEFDPTELDSYFLTIIEDTQANIVQLEQSLTELEAFIGDGQLNSLRDVELELLKNDYLYLARTGEVVHSELIPMNDVIFMPNAYINYKLSEWKLEHDIDFVPPGGPYHTLFVPTYEESPRSGDMEPPLGIDRPIFDQYLDEVSGEHRYLSGLNLLADIFNQYYYLAILILFIGFYSLSYVREWDGQETIRYLLVQPISITRIFISKMMTSIGMGLSFIGLAFVIVFVIGSLLNGIGQINFPFVQYISDSLSRVNPDQYLEIPMHLKFFQIIPLWQWLLMGGALLLSNVLMINQLAYFFSTFSRNQWVVMGMTVLILGVGYLVTIFVPFQFMQISPFHYLDIGKTLSGEIAVQYDYQWLNWWVGVISQTALSLVLTVIALVRVRKKIK